VVLLSGGLDSAVVLALARRAGLLCHALSFDYGQRHRHELLAAARVAAALGAADHRTISIDLRAVGGSALTSDAIDVPREEGGAGAPAKSGSRPGGEAAPAVPVTYVPARNMVFLSLAAGLAEVVGAEELHLGINAVDYSGYPDCRPEFVEAFERALALGTKVGSAGRPLRVVAPLVRMSKGEIISAGAAMGVDFGMTASCYDPDGAGRACGVCASCGIRRRGFEAAGVVDPTVYVR
jgi:7-cyano-7-deazaguanine synthase